MAPIFTVLSLLLLLPALSSAAGDNSSAPSGDDLVAELESLRSKSPAGLIHLNDRLVSRFLLSAPIPRPYHLIVFFDSIPHSQAILHLHHLRGEFAAVAKSFAAHHRGLPSASKLFFCDIEFGESEASFLKFGIFSLPQIRLVSPATESLNESESMDSAAYSRLADAMAELVESETNLSVGPILRPPPVSPHRRFVFLIVPLIAAPFFIKKIASLHTLLRRDYRAWMAGAVLVYFFSISGSMYMIIRRMPVYQIDRDGRPVFFYHGSRGQLGAEGFIVGFLYTAVGLVLASVTHDLVRGKSAAEQRGLMLVSLVVMVWAVWKVIKFQQWKTGYNIRALWPSNWD